MRWIARLYGRSQSVRVRGQFRFHSELKTEGVTILDFAGDNFVLYVCVCFFIVKVSAETGLLGRKRCNSFFG